MLIDKVCYRIYLIQTKILSMLFLRPNQLFLKELQPVSLLYNLLNIFKDSNKIEVCLIITVM